MDEFSSQLLRLKQALGVVEDQDVAHALGMTKAAFSDRKRRGAFPAEKLRATAAAHPEWHMDVDFVLTGSSRVIARRDLLLELVARSAAIASRYDMSDVEKAALQEDIFNALRAASPSGDERDLLDHFRAAGSTARAAIIAAAAALAGTPTRAQPSPSKLSRKPRTKT